MQLFANNADSSLNGAIASDTAVLVLKAGEGGKFPSPTNGDFFLVTLFQRVGTTELSHEIVKCTSRVGDNLTVVRAQEGTTAKAFNSGDLVELRFTKGTAENFPQLDALATKEPVIAAPGSAPTEKYWRGDKTWRDFFTDVRAATLAGLSTATNAVVAATDTVLAAIGKLQAQVSTKFDKTGGTITGNVLVQREVNGTASIDVSNTDGEGLNAAAGLTLRIGADAIGYMQLFKLLNELQIGTSTNTSVGVYINGGIALRIGTDKSILATSGALGYGVGAGGTVVQATSKSTAVTLNKPTGEITMNAATLDAGGSVSFAVNCSFFAVEDAISAQQVGSNRYRVETYTASGGVFGIRVTNIANIALAEALKVRFVILKGASA